MTEQPNARKASRRSTHVGLKLALAASSLVASLLGANLLARAPDANAQAGTSAEAGQQVVVVRRYVEVGSGQPVGSTSSQVTLPPIPTALPYVPYVAPPVTSTRSS